MRLVRTNGWLLHLGVVALEGELVFEEGNIPSLASPHAIIHPLPLSSTRYCPAPGDISIRSGIIDHGGQRCGRM